MFHQHLDAFKLPIKYCQVINCFFFSNSIFIDIYILLIFYEFKAQGLEKSVKIRIEPSIFEFLGWYDKGLPTFLGVDALLNFGYNIDVNYRQLLPVERLQPDENYTDYYQRSFNSTKYLSNLHQGEGNFI